MADHRADDPALRPWNADEERTARTHGPMEQFGSLGMIFAVAASAFTRHPMTSALNAGAAAMTAIQAGDEKAYKSAYEAWKSNADLAIKRFDMERVLYDEANKLATTDMAMWNQKTLMLATQFGNEKEIAMLNAGMGKEVLERQATQAKTKEGLEEAIRRQVLFNQQQEAYTASMEAFNEEHPNPTQKERALALLEATRKSIQAGKGQETGDEKFQHAMALQQARLEAQLEKAKFSQEGKEKLAKLTADQRMEVQQYLEGGRNARAEMSLGARTYLAELSSSDRRAVEEIRQAGAQERLELNIEARSAEKEKDREVQLQKIRQSESRQSMSSSDAAEVKSLTEKYTNDEDSPTHGDAHASRERAAEKVLAAHRSKKIEAVPTLTEAALKTLAERDADGDRTALSGLGYGAVGAANRAAVMNKSAEIMEARGESGADRMRKAIEFQADARGASNLAQLESRMVAAISKAQQTAPVVLTTSEKVNRTSFPSINAIEAAIAKGGGGEDIIRFNIAIKTLISNYATTLGQGNSVLTDNAREEAKELIATKYSKGQIRVAVDQMQKEMQRELDGVKKAQGTFLDKGGKPASVSYTGSKPEGFQFDKDGWRWEVVGGKLVPQYQVN